MIKSKFEEEKKTISTALHRFHIQSRRQAMCYFLLCSSLVYYSLFVETFKWMKHSILFIDVSILIKFSCLKYQFVLVLFFCFAVIEKQQVSNVMKQNSIQWLFQVCMCIVHTTHEIFLCCIAFNFFLPKKLCIFIS